MKTTTIIYKSSAVGMTEFMPTLIWKVPNSWLRVLTEKPNSKRAKKITKRLLEINKLNAKG